MSFSDVMNNNLSFVTGNIFHTSMQTIAITVNCRGVMGKGIALYIKEHVPEAYEKYKELCNSGEMNIGKLVIYDNELPILKTDNGYKKLLFFPTKVHWKNKSDLFGIRKGLEWFVEHYREMGIDSIAFPALGCGNGGLNWDKGVRPLMYGCLKDLDLEIEIYSPGLDVAEKNKSSKSIEKTNSDTKIIDF